jgi:hypothetical protein
MEVRKMRRKKCNKNCTTMEISIRKLKSSFRASLKIPESRMLVLLEVEGFPIAL